MDRFRGGHPANYRKPYYTIRHPERSRPPPDEDPTPPPKPPPAPKPAPLPKRPAIDSPEWKADLAAKKAEWAALDKRIAEQGKAQSKSKVRKPTRMRKGTGVKKQPKAFTDLVQTLAENPDTRDPEALAAWIGRRIGGLKS
jgi:hypothetical protein